MTLVFPCPRYYSLTETCHAHGWKFLAPFCWDDGTEALTTAFSMGKSAVDINVRQGRREIAAIVVSHKALAVEQIERIRRAVARSLDSVRDNREFARIASKRHKSLVTRGAGRILRSPTLWEDAAKTLFTTNCSWRLTCLISERICSGHFALRTPSGRNAFPRPSSVARFTVPELRSLLPIGYRAEYLLTLADAFRTSSAMQTLDDAKISVADAYALASQLKGFGPYAAKHLLIMAGYYSLIPVDSLVTDYINRTHGRSDTDTFISEHYRDWGRYRWWGLKLEQMAQNDNWIGD